MPKVRGNSPASRPLKSVHGYDLAVADGPKKKSVALVRYIYSDSGRVEDIFSRYLQNKITG